MNRILVGVILISAFVSSLVIAQIVISQDTGGAPSTVARVVSPTSAPSAAPVTAPAAAPTVTAWKLPRPTATAVRVPATSSASTERSCAAGYRENRSLPFRLCDTGYGIDLIQRGLNTRGFAVVADGYFGQATAAQVRRFQSSRGLSATGDVDATTWLELVGLLDGYDQNGDGAVDPSEEFSGD